jgi:hypothetical protein
VPMNGKLRIGAVACSVAAIFMTACGGDDGDSSAPVVESDDAVAQDTDTTGARADDTTTTGASTGSDGELCALLTAADVAALAGVPLTGQRGTSRPTSPDPYHQCMYSPDGGDATRGVTITITEYDSPEAATTIYQGNRDTNAPRDLAGIGDAAAIKDERDTFMPLLARFGARILTISFGRDVYDTVHANGEALLRGVADRLQPLLT